MWRAFLLFILILTGLTNAMADNRQAAPHTDFNKVVLEIQQSGDILLTQYNGKNCIDIMNGFSKLYFDHYEGECMELAVMAIAPQINIQTESLFTQLIGQS